MRIEEKLKPQTGAVLRTLGYGAAQPDGETLRDVEKAIEDVANATVARWCARGFTWANGRLAEAGFALPGEAIGRHLQGCGKVQLMAVTLGAGVDALLRTAGAVDIRRAVLLDAAASELIELYADRAGALLLAMPGGGPYQTPRFSPGYGDLPLELQPELVRLLDGPRAIGLTVAASGMMIPAKSITAIIGIAEGPVSGHLAGCEGCALNGKCQRQKEGNTCAKTNT